MLRRVPIGISCFRGTMAVSTVCSDCRANFTWLPFWLTSAKPAVSSRRLTSRYGSGLSRPNLDLDGAHLRRARSVRGLEVQLEGFAEILQSLFFGGALAGDIDLQTLRYVPVAFAPDGRSEWSLHANIVS